MNCPFCREKEVGRFTSCPGCQAGKDGLTQGQMMVLSDKIRAAKRDVIIIEFCGAGCAAFIGLSVWFFDSILGIVLSSVFLVLSVIMWIDYLREISNLEWILTWWSKNKT